jgi:hypothetical protein
MKDKIHSYFEQLKDAASGSGVCLLQAFVKAGVSDGTYYRARKGQTELRESTAQKVLDSLRSMANEGSAAGTRGS